MCQISEFQNILDSNYIRIGLSKYVNFGLGLQMIRHSSKNLFKSVKKIQNHTSSRMRDQTLPQYL